MLSLATVPADVFVLLFLSFVTSVHEVMVRLKVHKETFTPVFILQILFWCFLIYLTEIKLYKSASLFPFRTPSSPGKRVCVHLMSDM